MALLEIRDLSWHFGGLAAVDGLSFNVEQGAIPGTGGGAPEGPAIEPHENAQVGKAYLGG